MLRSSWLGNGCPFRVPSYPARERPVIPERERAEILAALDAVDAVVIFDALTPREVISRLLPDVLVKGGDWPGDQIVGRGEVEAGGGRVVSIPVVPGYSTTAILQTIRENSSGKGSRNGLPREGSGQQPPAKNARVSRQES